MKIKPVEHPENPGYPDYEQLAKKKGGKKLMTLIAHRCCDSRYDGRL